MLPDMALSNRRHLKKLDLEREGTCRFCENMEVIPMNFLSECDATSLRNIETSGKVREVEYSQNLGFLGHLNLGRVLYGFI